MALEESSPQRSRDSEPVSVGELRRLAAGVESEPEIHKLQSYSNIYARVTAVTKLKLDIRLSSHRSFNWRLTLSHEGPI